MTSDRPETTGPHGRAASLVVTTARKLTEASVAEAARWSQLLSAPVARRGGRSIEALCRDEQVSGVLVLGGDRPVYYEPAAGLEFFFHPNMAAVRVHTIQHGQPDHMIEAMQLAPGDAVLDCTMGRGADAILCAFVVGDSGRVLAIEKVPVIAHLTMEGLHTAEYGSRRLIAAMRRVHARRADYREFLPTCETATFDVVYFDPLFHEPVEQSESMASLRALAHRESVTSADVQAATRVARRRVVVKQRRGTPLWDELGITEVKGGKQSRVEYGVLETGDSHPFSPANG